MEITKNALTLSYENDLKYEEGKCDENDAETPYALAMEIEDPEERARVIEAINARRRGCYERHHGDKSHIVSEFAKEHNIDVATAEKIFSMAAHKDDGNDRGVEIQSPDRLKDEMQHFAAKKRWQGAIGAVKDEVRLQSELEEWNYAVMARWVSLYRTEDMEPEHRPYMTVGFVVVQVIFFIVYAVIQGDSVEYASPSVGPESFFMEIVDVGSCTISCQGGENVYAITEYVDQRAEIWRYFTYSICHIGYGHLFGNAVVEIILGVPLDMVHGSLRMAAVGVLSILGGALTISWGDPYLAVVGSSGYGFGLIGVHFGNLILNWKDLHDATTLPPIPNNVLRLGILLVLGLFLNSSWIVSKVNDEDDGTSHAAHLGGFVAGLLFSVPILRELGRHRYQHQLRIGATVLGCAYLLFGVIWTASQWRPTWLIYNSSSWDPERDWCSAGGEVGEIYGATC
uniref:Peptidase S54 rhomboid domain-containing protein n=1 Tax=Phaeomonas parva TaxID=124430 RepID=A0A7S1XK59_9STRA|mmetsp:Transcript_10313/g.30847  ORF Transcript_10313/g.30847 Transcript_10313/m.30847 type:complete len:455 (+) Transcript_10313:253-1617(+)